MWREGILEICVIFLRSKESITKKKIVKHNNYVKIELVLPLIFLSKKI
jgi:hypothetical protein